MHHVCMSFAVVEYVAIRDSMLAGGFWGYTCRLISRRESVFPTGCCVGLLQVRANKWAYSMGLKVTTILIVE